MFITEDEDGNALVTLPLDELEDYKKTIAKLTEQVASWKQAWFDQRDATGKMAWEIPQPSYLSSEKQRKFVELAKQIKE